jgi:hypothetical protein
MKSLLIYDADCPYCAATARIASLSRKIERLPYNDERSQKLLDEVFDEPGFTLYLFEKDAVYWGNQAAGRVSDILGFPGFLREFFIRTYLSYVRVVSFLVRREREVAMPMVCQDEVCVTDAGSGGHQPIGDEVQELLKKVFSSHS